MYFVCSLNYILYFRLIIFDPLTSSIFTLDAPFALIYVKHTELPLCMKCAIEINLPCLAFRPYFTQKGHSQETHWALHLHIEAISPEGPENR